MLLANSWLKSPAHRTLPTSFFLNSTNTGNTHLMVSGGSGTSGTAQIHSLYAKTCPQRQESKFSVKKTSLIAVAQLGSWKNKGESILQPRVGNTCTGLGRRGVPLQTLLEQESIWLKYQAPTCPWYEWLYKQFLEGKVWLFSWHTMKLEINGV